MTDLKPLGWNFQEKSPVVEPIHKKKYFQKLLIKKDLVHTVKYLWKVL